MRAGLATALLALIAAPGREQGSAVQRPRPWQLAHSRRRGSCRERPRRGDYTMHQPMCIFLDSGAIRGDRKPWVINLLVFDVHGSFPATCGH